MGITAKRGSSREPVPAGTYPARLYKIIHFGTIPDTYQGQQKMTNKIRFDWELPTETRVFDPDMGEQPLSISKDYTLSMNEKANLCKDVESWEGHKFKSDEEAESYDLTELIGRDCMINVAHKTSNATGNTYAYIASISPMPKGMQCPPPVNSPFIWDYSDNWDPDVLELLHDYFKDKIKSSQEYQAKMEPIDVQDAPMPTINDAPPEDDQLPF